MLLSNRGAQFYPQSISLCRRITMNSAAEMAAKKERECEAIMQLWAEQG